MTSSSLKSFTIEKDGCPLHYWLNDAAGPVVVFSHGMKMDHRMFTQQVDPMINTGYRLLLWDIRGHGKSRPMGEDITIPLAADDLLAVLDHVGIDRVVLMGHSFGGFISQEFAFRYPDRVQGMFILGSLPITHKPPMLVHLIRPLSKLFFFCCPSPIMYWLTGRVAGKSQWARDNAKEIARQVPRNDFLKIWNAVLNCGHVEPGYQPPMPCMITRGSGDCWVGLGLIKRTSKKWADSITNCRHAVIPNAGHNACGDNPDAFNALLLDFLSTLQTLNG